MAVLQKPFGDERATEEAPAIVYLAAALSDPAAVAAEPPAPSTVVDIKSAKKRAPRKKKAVETPPAVEPPPLPARPEPEWEKMPAAWHHPEILDPGCGPDYLEQFRLLRTQLLLHKNRLGESGFSTLAVMSTLAGEGKSFTALNLAATLAASANQRVLLIESSFNHANPAALLTVSSGLREALADPLQWDASVRKVAGQPLYVLPFTQTAPGPVNLEPLPALLAELRPHFAWIVVDGASFADTPESAWIAETCDRTLFVVRQGRPHFDALHEALARVAPDRIVGVVLNHTNLRPPRKFRIKLRLGS